MIQVATPKGLKEFALVEGVTTGDQVTIIAGMVTKESNENIEVYFI